MMDKGNHSSLLKRALRSVGYRWVRAFPHAVFPVWLPFGACWLVQNDSASMAILHGEFEPRECAFVERFLQPGMTVLDIGAHHGFYSLLASRKVGPNGRVISFEPSPRERKRLTRHIKVNLCRNVSVEGLALGRCTSQAELFVVEGMQTGFNSLRPPDVTAACRKVLVPVLGLDEYLDQHGIHRVDFIKLDVEGGEIEVLRGAADLLRRQPRPIILCEVEEVRTKPWGYHAREIIDQLKTYGYSFFRPVTCGGLEPVPPVQHEFDGNYVCVPSERLGEIVGRLESAC
jgi:FkbM family methyltransferase